MELISAFVELKHFVEFLLLNKNINRKLINSQQYKDRLIQYLSKFFKIKLSQSTYQAFILSKTSINLPNETSILSHFPCPYNYILNPYGSFLFDGWEKRGNGEDWLISSETRYQNYETSFVASYDWCELEFSTDISSPGPLHKALIAGSPVSRDAMCPAKAKVSIEVTNEDPSLSRLKESMLSLSHDQADLAIEEFPWQLLSVCVELVPGDKSARVIFGGMDENFWKSNYGPRFGYCYLRELTL